MAREEHVLGLMHHLARLQRREAAGHGGVVTRDLGES
jgi:hypothetical protein